MRQLEAERGRHHVRTARVFSAALLTLVLCSPFVPARAGDGDPIPLLVIDVDQRKPIPNDSSVGSTDGQIIPTQPGNSDSVRQPAILFDKGMENPEDSNLDNSDRRLEPTKTDGNGPAQTRVLHVDKRNAVAADSNIGSANSPLLTLQEATGRAIGRYRKGLSTEIVIGPGVYRESIELKAGKAAPGGAIRYSGSEGTVVSGSEVWDDWTRVGNSLIYAHSWPLRWGPARIPSSWRGTYAGADMRRNPILRRREMIFVSGSPLSQVLSHGALMGTEGTFYVAQRRGTVYVNPAKGESLEDKTVEVAVRPLIFSSHNVDNVTMTNLTFRHAASPIESKAVSISKGDGVAIIGSRFVWNNWLGLGISESRNVTIRSTVANHNGVGGISGSGIDNLLLEDTETSYNNWRGSSARSFNGAGVLDGNFTDWASGQKFFRLRNAVFRRHNSISNLTGGLWFDWDNKDILLEGVRLQGNATHGLFVEASPGPITVRLSLICGNETGILLGNSANGTINQNFVADNRISEIFLAGDPYKPRLIDDRDTGKWSGLMTENWSFYGNIVSTLPGKTSVGTWLGADPWKRFVETLSSNANVWQYSQDPKTFQVSGGERLDLDGWKSHSGEDRASLALPNDAGCPATLPQEMPAGG